MTIPQAALSLREGFSYVFRLGEHQADDKAKVTQVKVKLGQRSGDITKSCPGLKPKIRLVASGAAFLADGDSVRVVQLMNVSAWCIRNPIPALMLFVLLTFGGLYSFHAMQIQNFPDLDLPTITVMASLPGASPSQLETDVARKIENSIATLQGLKHITTKIQDGSVNITVQIPDWKNRYRKPWMTCVPQWQKSAPICPAICVIRCHQAGLCRVRRYWLIRSLLIQRDDEALSWFVEDTIGKRLLPCLVLAISNAWAGLAGKSGLRLDPIKLQSLGATAADISRQL